MKIKLLFMALALAVSVNVEAQSFFEKIGRAVERGVERGVQRAAEKQAERAVEKTVDKALSGSSTPSSDNKSNQSQQNTQSRNKNYDITPPVVESENTIPTTGEINGHQWVDLGLPSGTRWATCNIDATREDQPGGHYAWGEITTKSSYSNENGKYYKKDIDDFSGDKTKDVATAKWGKGWRMPTQVEFDELVYYCNFKYVQKNGRYGAELTSIFNGKSIFLPVGGYKEGSKLSSSQTGLYWTATPYKDQYNNGAHQYHFGAALGEMGVGERSEGYSIRAVATNEDMISTPSQGELNGHAWVDLGLPSGTKWATCNVGAASTEHLGLYFRWGETISITKRSQGKSYELEGTKTDIGGIKRYDAATALWGDGWQMPSKQDFEELMDNCTFEWTSLGRVKGCKVISKINGNYIFLPATGLINSESYSGFYYPGKLHRWAQYWCSTPSYSDDAYGFWGIYGEKIFISNILSRKDPHTIRPVVK
ncbi:MAG: hypothetical protein IKT29_04700 [Flavobacteriales bacterium]|nr:hypothetical protein [Flavobacteriales bacterium]